MSTLRPHIPTAVMREVRQRCGFGCVICGSPVYEYDHIKGWANVRRHVSDEITLLCKKHHGEKTLGLLPEEIVLKANASPYNLKNGNTSGYKLHFSGGACEISMGGLRFTPSHTGVRMMAPIMINSHAPILFEMDHDELFLGIGLIDGDGRDVFRIERNELRFITDFWDVEFVGTRLTIREKSRIFFLELDFRPPHRVIVKRFSFECDGYAVRIEPKHINMKYPHGHNVTIKGEPSREGQPVGTVSGSIGILIGEAPEGYAPAINASL